MGKKQRNSNLELLRILSILYIVFHHYYVYGVMGETFEIPFNEYFLDLALCAHVAINCFVLISGYFMAKQKVTLKKILTIAGEVWFYSVGILLLFMTVLTPETPVGISTIVKSFLPIGYGRYWFVTGFVLLMIFSPYMNLLMEHMTQKQHLSMLLSMVLIWSVSSTFISTVWGFSGTVWLFVLYFTGGYIRFYLKPENAKPVKYLACGLAMFAITFTVTLILNYIGREYGISGIYENKNYFVRENSVLSYISSIFFFLYFLTRKPFCSKTVNLISSASFGVYLIHENVLMRPFLWHSICRAEDWASSPWLPVHALVCVLGIFAVCTVIDLLRSVSVEKLWLKLIDAAAEPVRTKLSNLIDRIID